MKMASLNCVALYLCRMTIYSIMYFIVFLFSINSWKIELSYYSTTA